MQPAPAPLTRVARASPPSTSQPATLSRLQMILVQRIASDRRRRACCSLQPQRLSRYHANTRRETLVCCARARTHGGVGHWQSVPTANRGEHPPTAEERKKPSPLFAGCVWGDEGDEDRLYQIGTPVAASMLYLHWGAVRSVNILSTYLPGICHPSRRRRAGSDARLLEVWDSVGFPSPSQLHTTRCCHSRVYSLSCLGHGKTIRQTLTRSASEPPQSRTSC